MASTVTQCVVLVVMRIEVYQSNWVMKVLRRAPLYRFSTFQAIPSFAIRRRALAMQRK